MISFARFMMDNYNFLITDENLSYTYHSYNYLYFKYCFNRAMTIVQVLNVFNKLELSENPIKSIKD